MPISDVPTMRPARHGASQHLLTGRARLCLITALVAACALQGAARAATAPETQVDLPEGVLLAGRDFHGPDQQLTGLIQDLLATQPLLLAARARWQASSEVIAQEKALPDPLVTYRWFASTPETRVGPQEHALEVSQQVPWRGKRGSASQRAAHLAGSAAWNVRGQARTLVARLKHDYFHAAYLQEALAINQEESDLLRRFEAIALTRYATGMGIQQSVVKVQTEISRLVDQRINLRRRLDVVQESILNLMGQPERELQLQTIMLRIHPMEPVEEEWVEAALASHPRIKDGLERAAADEALVRRRALEARPDFRFGVGYTMVGRREDALGVAFPPEDNGKDILALTVGFNLPVHRRRIRAAAAEAELRHSATRMEVAGTRDDLLFLFRDALHRQEESAQRARLYEEVIIPQAEASLGSAEAAYATSRIDFLELLDSERVLFQVRLTYHQLLTDHWTALADLEYSLGTAYPAADPTDHQAHAVGSDS
jgi:cobalt-zinc-cadmium efflux system outer membrane protein